MQAHDNGTLLKIIEEIKEELTFIKEELRINIAGPCKICSRRWCISPRTGKKALCTICGITVCPTCPKMKCYRCGFKVCLEHYHTCDFCDGFCTNCIVDCEFCGKICRTVAGNMCEYPHCTSCPKHSPLNAIDDNIFLCRVHYPIETELLQEELVKDFL